MMKGGHKKIAIGFFCGVLITSAVQQCLQIPDNREQFNADQEDFVPTMDGDVTEDKKMNTNQEDVVPTMGGDVTEDEKMNNRHILDTYKYLSPSVNETEVKGASAEIDCGSKPDFAEYFKSERAFRSRLFEDKIIYETFFQQHPATNDDFQGSYIELGAFDGMKESNTRFFEQCLGWGGLLIEGNQKKYISLIENRPRAHRISFAPSCEKEGETIQFFEGAHTDAGLVGKAKSVAELRKHHKIVDVPCGPLGPVLESIFAGYESINYFSLDVEGSEDMVLNTIAFDKVRIDVLMIEVENRNCQKNSKCEVRDNVRAKMEKEGYVRYENMVAKSDVYVHPQSPFQVASHLQNKKGFQPVVHEKKITGAV